MRFEYLVLYLFIVGFEVDLKIKTKNKIPIQKLIESNSQKDVTKIIIYLGNVGMTPIETQRAECTLISGDVRASAEATVSRKLEGFCSTGNFI